MKRSGIDRPGAAGVIRGQSPRKSALSSPRTRLAEATAVRALAIVDTVATLSSPPPHLRHSLHHCHRHHHVVIATLAVSAVSAIVTLAIAIFANSPEKGLLPQRRVNL